MAAIAILCSSELFSDPNFWFSSWRDFILSLICFSCTHNDCAMFVSSELFLLNSSATFGHVTAMILLTPDATDS